MVRTKRIGTAILTALTLASCASEARAWHPRDLFEPCAGDCAAAVYWGREVLDGLDEVLLTDPSFPWTWEYSDEEFVGGTLSRRTGTLGFVELEPEVGVGQRFGEQNEIEVWGALYFRYRGFPWDRFVSTSVALSTGLNYATDISEREREKARGDSNGNRLMHYFSPEVTFALPNRPEAELLFRFPHRSGVFGLVSDSFGGVQYGTVGIRARF